ncbi:Autophagy-related protein 2 [Linum perenne]
MFPWNIAKSAEAVLSQWALKRLCKFVLKKKLGQFILGEIDLQQLDVQLGQGVIHLSDLALDVDYLNEKLGAVSSVVIKEGSIGSLSVTMPWKGNGFEVEVDELELVLRPCLKNEEPIVGDKFHSSQDKMAGMHNEMGKLVSVLDPTVKSGSADIHEGVKTIAKMVKWFLASFHVRIKKLLVAFDPHLGSEKEAGGHKIVVLRIAEMECGTSVSEDVGLSTNGTTDDLLGISRLTNFLKFQGAVLELLEMNDAKSESVLSKSLSGPTSGEVPANRTTSILLGDKGGFSGELKLSIPWNNGSLDIRQVDANVCIDPVELRVQPGTIKWFLLAWKAYKILHRDSALNTQSKPTDSVYFNSGSQLYSSTRNSASSPTANFFSAPGTSPQGQQSFSESVLPESNLIPDWMPNSVKDGVQELDLGASVDQFFECFDGIRNSQSALGSSGMWGWTCSVFGALTAASSLASGSLLVTSEQQHMQTNLKVRWTGVSIVLFIQDENDQYCCKSTGDNHSLNVHHITAECKDISVVVQVSPQQMIIDGNVRCIEVTETSQSGKGSTSFPGSFNDGQDQTLQIQHLQADILSALPRIAPSTDGLSSNDWNAPHAYDIHSGKTKCQMLSTSGVTHCQFIASSVSSHGDKKVPASFSVHLPHFVFWVNLISIKMLMDLVKDMSSAANTSSWSDEKSSSEKHGSSVHESKRDLEASSATEKWRCNISIPSARIILCFPLEVDKLMQNSYCWDQFVSIDFSSPSVREKGKIHGQSPVADLNSWKRYISSPAWSVYVSVGDLGVHLISSRCKNDIGVMDRMTFCVQKVLSVSNRVGCLSTVSIVSQDTVMTGPWVVERAKFMATSEESRTRGNSNAKGHEFATVTAVKDIDDMSSRTRRDILLTSAFVLHVHLPPCMVDLDSSQYCKLVLLMGQMIKGLSCAACESVCLDEEPSVSQTSVLVECDSLEVSIRPDTTEERQSSLQSELPGSWLCFKLKIRKLELMSVSRIGGIENANLLWVTHREGKLWGSVTSNPNKMFLLISCSNSVRKRGDGGGSNALSSRWAGSDIVHLRDPGVIHSITSITIRCATVVAIGGRLDWFDAIFSFFNLSSPEVENTDHTDLQEGGLRPTHQTSFLLKLVDVGLSYEPHFKSSVSMNNSSHSSSTNAGERDVESYFACLVAASSLTVSSTAVEDSVDNDYKIRVHDLGFLLSKAPQNPGGIYSVDYLRDMRYIKVAQEALIEAVLRTNSKNGLHWELECSKLHVWINTCHDTTSGLTRLAAQLQQLFAPDLEEAVVHLQARWNNFCQAQEKSKFNEEGKAFIHDSNAATSGVLYPSGLTENEPKGIVGLMDEISEDAFSLATKQKQPCQLDSAGPAIRLLPADSLVGLPYGICSETQDTFLGGVSCEQSSSVASMGITESSFLENGSLPEFIESYCISDLRPLSELSIGCIDPTARVNSGWYEELPVSIVEDHISDTGGSGYLNQFLDDKFLECCTLTPDDPVKATGRVLLKDINVSWKMYAGSDWGPHGMNTEPSKCIGGRDTTTCLELSLCGMELRCDFFPLGGVCASKISLSIQDFYLYDKSNSAPWKLMLGYYHSKDHPRTSNAKALKLDLEAVRPDPLIPLEEYRHAYFFIYLLFYSKLQVSFLPIRVHLHQSQLDFLISFFTPEGVSADGQKHPSGVESLAISSADLAGHSIAPEALLPYFQASDIIKFDVSPILIRVDYTPSRVDLTALGGGKYVELVNLVPWKGVELELKHVHACGVYGWDSVCETMLGEWLEDISQNQVRKILRGLPTIRSFVSVGSGAAKLVSLPVQSYKKDQRVLKGMQRGTVAFLRSISLEAVGLGVHLAAGAHDILLQAEYILTSVPSPVSSSSTQGKKKSNVRKNQPNDAQEGIQQACASISDGLGKSASALVRTPLKKYQYGSSAGSALASAVRGIPAAAIAPVSACASAAHYALLGLRNSLDPEHKKESMEKYLGPTQTHNND